MNEPRFIIEGTWSGYRSSQQRICHRTVHKGSRKLLRAWAEKTHGIRYTDGTMLYLTVRDCKPREKVKEIKGYVELINDCFHYDVTSVSALQAAQKDYRAVHKAEVKVQREEMLIGSTVAIARYLRKGADYIEQLERESAERQERIEELEGAVRVESACREQAETALAKAKSAIEPIEPTVSEFLRISVLGRGDVPTDVRKAAEKLLDGPPYPEDPC